MTKKVLSVFGTRPEAIKMAPVVLALNADSRFESRVCVTGQHRLMLDSVLKTFDIRPNWDLNVMHDNQTLVDLTARLLTGVRRVLIEERPDIVLVHGDTTTCLAAALCAFYEQTAVGHVEAGLRTWNLLAPFPEEANRTLVAKLAAINYAPTFQARDNLIAEGIDARRIEITGNTVVDALFAIRAKVNSTPHIVWKTHFGVELYNRLTDPDRILILVTGHRRENFGHGLAEICAAIRDMARLHQDWDFVYPVHLNPNVLVTVRGFLADIDNIYLIAPQEYEPFVWLMMRSKLILTDSGGIQEEAPSLKKPALVMRNATERPEAISAGFVRIVRSDRDSIVQNVMELLTDESAYEKMIAASNPFGDGEAARRIVEHLAILDA